jgi:hypothetical protein
VRTRKVGAGTTVRGGVYVRTGGWYTGAECTTAGFDTGFDVFAGGL